MVRLVPIPFVDEDGYLLADEDGAFLIAEGDEEVEPTLQPCPFCRDGCFVCGFTSWLVRD